MQLGMIGLGRMGANMVRRLLRGGHECVVFDRDAEAGEPRWPRKAPSARPRWQDLVARLADAARDLADGAGGRRSTRSIAELLPLLERGRHPDRRRQLVLRRRHPARQGARRKRTSLCRRRHQRRRLGPGARLLHDDRRRRPRRWSASIRSSRRSRRAPATCRRTPGRDKRGGTAEQGYLHCGPQRRRPLRQDGPQRHRVRPHGRLCRRSEHPASTPMPASTTRRRMPRPRRCAIPSTTSTTSTCRDIAEVWRRGSVIASWLLDLTAAALVEDPGARRNSPAACPIPAKAAGPSRRRSTRRAGAGADRGACMSASVRAARPICQNKLLSAMRFEFGGHVEKPAAQVTASMRVAAMSECAPTRWSSSAPPATWPTRRSFRPCRRWSSAAAWTCR